MRTLFAMAWGDGLGALGPRAPSGNGFAVTRRPLWVEHRSAWGRGPADHRGLNGDPSGPAPIAPTRALLFRVVLASRLLFWAFVEQSCAFSLVGLPPSRAPGIEGLRTWPGPWCVVFRRGRSPAAGQEWPMTAVGGEHGRAYIGLAGLRQQDSMTHSSTHPPEFVGRPPRAARSRARSPL